mmetsp:Transcript_34887/g.96282  ORF Transcript_34887/g.96282 Transcript_34887/m.96282 type:complete len:205 (-) Transcript_34887:647-1261(-)
MPPRTASKGPRSSAASTFLAGGNTASNGPRSTSSAASPPSSGTGSKRLFRWRFAWGSGAAGDMAPPSFTSMKPRSGEKPTASSAEARSTYSAEPWPRCWPSAPWARLRQRRGPPNCCSKSNTLLLLMDEGMPLSSTLEVAGAAPLPVPPAFTPPAVSPAEAFAAAPPLVAVAPVVGEPSAIPPATRSLMETPWSFARVLLLSWA